MYNIPTWTKPRPKNHHPPLSMSPRKALRRHKALSQPKTITHVSWAPAIFVHSLRGSPTIWRRSRRRRLWCQHQEARPAAAGIFVFVSKRRSALHICAGNWVARSGALLSLSSVLSRSREMLLEYTAARVCSRVCLSLCAYRRSVGTCFLGDCVWKRAHLSAPSALYEYMLFAIENCNDLGVYWCSAAAFLITLIWWWSLGLCFFCLWLIWWGGCVFCGWES